MSKEQNEHGTIASYVIGFGLSLVFTAIPYYLVVGKVVTGTALLGTVLGFAVLQMLVQVFFFLHLGRGPKPLYNVAFFVGTVGFILMVVAGALFIMSHLYHNMAPSEVSKKLAEDEGIHQIEGQQTGACKGHHTDHKVIIKYGRVGPRHTDVRYCDTLTFVNEDEIPREITFGTHPQHGSYAGHLKLTVRKGRAKTITLNQTGTYQFHDHLDPAATGTFTVASQARHDEAVR